MATRNKELHSLTRNDVDCISLEYLKGWQDLIGNGYSFRIKGFNRMREKFGLDPLTREMSNEYRVKYVREHYTDEEIRNIIIEYMRKARVGDTRWTGIELFGCRFGREYAKLFKQLMGACEYRKLAEEMRRQKSIETQTALYGGVGLAGKEAKRKAEATNFVRHGGKNVMNDAEVRAKLVDTNSKIYGGPSPFSDSKLRCRAAQKSRSELAKAMQEYKRTGCAGDPLCESRAEFIAFKLLVDRFGAADVYCQYGIHPYDSRYPYNCDLYVKSLDLFIELNFYYVHGKHWFNPNSHDDMLRLKHLRESDKPKDKKAIRVWTIDDVEKRKKAAASGLRYLVFWYKNQNQQGMAEFYKWFIDYDCDYQQFIQDYPCNTY